MEAESIPGSHSRRAVILWWCGLLRRNLLASLDLWPLSGQG